MKQIIALYDSQTVLENEIATLEETIAGKKAELRNIAETELPEAIRDAELTNGATLDDGRVVVLTTSHHPNITKADESKAFEWFVANKHEAMVKRSFEFSFGLKEYAFAQSFAEMIKRLFPWAPVTIISNPVTPDAVVEQLRAIAIEHFPGRAMHETVSVPPATLKAWVKKRIESGETLPPFIQNFTRTRVTLTSVPPKSP